uniref:Vacuolar sorting protein 39/Transforming growth factor beta receptor-associated domain-containing protein n=1 Tax=Paramoeba aestuarina TaxID=180227 RepID=A0A7S4PG98_9EUKA
MEVEKGKEKDEEEEIVDGGDAEMEIAEPLEIEKERQREKEKEKEKEKGEAGSDGVAPPPPSRECNNNNPNNLPSDGFLFRKREDAGKEKGELGQIRAKLLKFLKTSTLLDANEILEKIGDKFPLFQEKILLFDQMRDFSSCLRVMVMDTGEYKRAEEYCVKWEGREERDREEGGLVGGRKRGGGEGGEGSEVFRALLSLYLQSPVFTSSSPPSSPTSSSSSSPSSSSSSPFSQQDKEQAIHAFGLMIKYSPSHLPPPLVLSLLPPSTPLSLLRPYLKHSFTSQKHQKEDVCMKKQLKKAVYDQNLILLQYLTGERVVVDHSTRCAVCGKVLGVCVFGVYDEGDCLVHAKCIRDEKLHPVTNKPLIYDL